MQSFQILCQTTQATNGSSLAKIALVVSIINATTAICAFVLTRFRLVKVREFVCLTVFTPDDSTGSKGLSVDILSYGAAIYDLAVNLQIWLPKGEELGGIVGQRYSVKFEPMRPKNPLNAGQGTRFLLRKSSLPPNFTFEQLAKALKGSKKTSLTVTCAEGRKTLKTITGNKINREVQEFFEVNIGAKPRAKMQEGNASFTLTFNKEDKPGK